MILLIDANAIGFKLQQSSGPDLYAGSQNTKAAYGFVNKLREFKIRFGASPIFLLWDGRSWRYKEYPEYKDGRQKTAKQRKIRADYKSQVPFIRKMAHALGYKQVFSSNMEADDLAALMVDKLKPTGERIRLVTSDGDWKQMISSRVDWIEPFGYNQITMASFEEATGYEDGVKFLQGKALQGDTSDNLKGVGGVGEATAATMLQVWPSIIACINDPTPEKTFKEATGKNLPKSIKDFRSDPAKIEAFKFNMRMMCLASVGHIPKPEEYRVIGGDVLEDEFKGICQQLGFKTVLDRFDEFLTPFKV